MKPHEQEMTKSILINRKAMDDQLRADTRLKLADMLWRRELAARAYVKAVCDRATR